MVSLVFRLLVSAELFLDVLQMGIGVLGVPSLRKSVILMLRFRLH